MKTTYFLIQGKYNLSFDSAVIKETSDGYFMVWRAKFPYTKNAQLETNEFNSWFDDGHKIESTHTMKDVEEFIFLNSI